MSSIKQFLIRFLFCNILFVSSSFAVMGQISVVMKNKSVREVINEIEKVSDYRFFYNDDLSGLDKIMSVDIKNGSIKNVMKEIAEQTGISYVMKANHQIVLSVTAVDRQKNMVKVRGKVIDDNGDGIIGASVVEKGTTNGVITDLNGYFSLNVPENTLIEISYIGYIVQEVPIAKRNNITVILKEDMLKLDEVVVVGYGKVKKSDLSAAVSTVKNVDKLQSRPISSVSQMLQGQIPGVTVVAQGGAPDSDPKITIRGTGSRSGESPLYVVDGIPGGQFSFSDVVSMTVLKDAASAAIYGAYAGSAGVVLITTKQAEAGKPSLEYNMVTGFSKVSNLPQSLTIEEERLVRATALGGEENLPAGWDVNKNPYIGETRTDWMDAIFHTAPYQRHNVALTAGTDKFSNRISLEYTNRQGTLINTYNESLIARLNSSFQLTKHIRIREDLTWYTSTSKGATTDNPEFGILTNALMMPRNAEVYAKDGSWGGTAPSDKEYIEAHGSNYADIHGDVINPVHMLEGGKSESRGTNLSTSTFLEVIEPIKGLNFTSRFTFKMYNYFNRWWDTRRLEPGKPFDQNQLGYSSQRKPEWNFENTLTYDRVFNRHNVGLMVSTTANEENWREFGITGRNFETEDDALMYFKQATSFLDPWDSYDSDRNVSFVGRASYSFADRYFVTASWRRDYAGRLPQGQKYGDFPSVTGAWKITSEPFMPKSDVLNLLKLRASWGRIGNLGSISKGYGYPVLDVFTVGSQNMGQQIGIDGPTLFGRYHRSGFNPLLTWEVSEQLDFGLDMTFLNNRLDITTDYFQKKTKGLIKAQDSGWPSCIGLDPIALNDGEIRNSGFEFAVNWADRVGKVNYWVNANLATLKNEVYNIGAADENGNKPVWTDGGSFKGINPYRTEEGQPLYSYYLIQSDGVFKSQAEIDAHVDKDGNKIQPKAEIGDLKFIDEDGDGLITEKDKIFMGNAMPKMTYAISGGFTWKDFTFSMMLQGVTGVKLFNAWKYLTLNESLGNSNRSRDILKALDGPCDEVPRISASDPNGNFTTVSDWYLESGDYLRIKNVSLGYSLTRLLHKNGYLADRKSSLDLTLSIDNLATFTSYSGIDPEIGGNGLDAGRWPVARTYSIAVKLKF